MHYNCYWHATSDIGAFRQRNEDAWGVLESANFFILADGMGGHPGGDVAATQAVHFLCRQIRNQKKLLQTSKQQVKDLLHTLKQTNDYLFAMSCQDEELTGMGTTICFVQVLQEELLYGHVGDSRIYHYSRGKLHQLTKDHSLLSELLDLGKISPEESWQFDKRNILTQAIGTKERVEPEVDICKINDGDKLLLCSDGLHDVLDKEEIKAVLQSTQSARQMVESLIKSAKKAKAKDNITAIVIHVKKANLS